MADLLLSGSLNLTGTLKLVGSEGGKVKAGDREVLVEITPKGNPRFKHGQAPGPVLIPPPPATPADDGIDIWIYKSFNATVTANDKKIIALGICAQGKPGVATWPGMVQPSIGNTNVKINQVAINVTNDSGLILPSGAAVTFTNSGQDQQ